MLEFGRHALVLRSQELVIDRSYSALIQVKKWISVECVVQCNTRVTECTNLSLPVQSITGLD